MPIAAITMVSIVSKVFKTIMTVKTNATPRPIVDSLYFVSISKAAFAMVDRHRIACIVVEYQRGRQMQFFAMTFI